MCESLSNGFERRSRSAWIINIKFSRYLRSMPHLPGHQAFEYQLISNNIDTDGTVYNGHAGEYQ